MIQINKFSDEKSFQKLLPFEEEIPDYEDILGRMNVSSFRRTDYGNGRNKEQKE